MGRAGQGADPARPHTSGSSSPTGRAADHRGGPARRLPDDSDPARVRPTPRGLGHDTIKTRSRSCVGRPVGVPLPSTRSAAWSREPSPGLPPAAAWPATTNPRRSPSAHPVGRDRRPTDHLTYLAPRQLRRTFHPARTPISNTLLAARMSCSMRGRAATHTVLILSRATPVCVAKGVPFVCCTRMGARSSSGSGAAYRADKCGNRRRRTDGEWSGNRFSHWRCMFLSPGRFGRQLLRPGIRPADERVSKGGCRSMLVAGPPAAPAAGRAGPDGAPASRTDPDEPPAAGRAGSEAAPAGRIEPDGAPAAARAGRVGAHAAGRAGPEAAPAAGRGWCAVASLCWSSGCG